MSAHPDTSLRLTDGPQHKLASSQLKQQGFAQLDAVLSEAFAGALRQCLLVDVPWTLAYLTEDGADTVTHQTYVGLSEEEKRRLQGAVMAQAQGDFGFCYESYMMVTAYLEHRDPGLLLHRMLELLNHPETLDTLRQLTGDATVNRLDAQATCYRAGHFLRYHNDFADNEHRRWAFVLNLSRNWQADWGGLLQILDGRDQVTATLMPRFNTLSLFRVPLDHCVSMVTPFAAEPRLAITGWLKQ